MISRCNKNCVSHKECALSYISSPARCPKCRDIFYSNDSRIKKMDGLVIHTTCYDQRSLFELCMIYDNPDELMRIYKETEREKNDKICSTRETNSTKTTTVWERSCLRLSKKAERARSILLARASAETHS